MDSARGNGGPPPPNPISPHAQSDAHPQNQEPHPPNTSQLPNRPFRNKAHPQNAHEASLPRSFTQNQNLPRYHIQTPSRLLSIQPLGHGQSWAQLYRQPQPYAPSSSSRIFRPFYAEQLALNASQERANGALAAQSAAFALSQAQPASYHQTQDRGRIQAQGQSLTNIPSAPHYHASHAVNRVQAFRQRKQLEALQTRHSAQFLASFFSKSSATTSSGQGRSRSVSPEKLLAVFMPSNQTSGQGQGQDRGQIANQTAIQNPSANMSSSSALVLASGSGQNTSQGHTHNQTSPSPSAPPLLSPILHPPTSLRSAISFLQRHNASQNTLASTLPRPPPRTVNVFLYDPVGAFVLPVRELTLRATTSISVLVLETQALLDQNLNLTGKGGGVGGGGGGLLVAGFMIRGFTNLAIMDSFPRIEGRVIGAKVDKDGNIVSGTGVVWECEGEDNQLRVYWEGYRRAVMIDEPSSGGGDGGDLEGKERKPMLKVVTIHREGRSVNLSHAGSGHAFSEVGDEGEDDREEEAPKSRVMVKSKRKEKEVVVDEGKVVIPAPKLLGRGKNKGESETETESAIGGNAVNSEKAKELAMLSARKIQEYGNPMKANETELLFVANILQEFKGRKDLYDEPTTEPKGAVRTKPKNTDAVKLYEGMLKDGHKPVKKLVLQRDGDSEDDSEVKDPKDKKTKKKKKNNKNKKKGKKGKKDSEDKADGDDGKDKADGDDGKDNWGDYQKMGGNPRIHAEFPLDKMPFPKKVIGADQVDDKEGPVPDSGIGKGKEPMAQMVPYQDIHPSVFDTRKNPSKPSTDEEIAQYHEMVDRAKGFDLEDDDIFFPDPTRNPPKKSEAKSEHTSPFPPSNEPYNPIPAARGSAGTTHSSLHPSPYLNTHVATGSAQQGIYGSSNPLLATTQRHNLGLQANPLNAAGMSFNTFNNMSSGNSNQFENAFSSMAGAGRGGMNLGSTTSGLGTSFNNFNMNAPTSNPYSSGSGLTGSSANFGNSNMNTQGSNYFGYNSGVTGTGGNFNMNTQSGNNFSSGSGVSGISANPNNFATAARNANQALFSNLRADSPAFTFTKSSPTRHGSPNRRGSPNRQSPNRANNNASGFRFQGTQFTPGNTGAGNPLTGGGAALNMSPVRGSSASGFRYQGNQFTPGMSSNIGASNPLTGGVAALNMSPVRGGSASGFRYQGNQFTPGMSGNTGTGTPGASPTRGNSAAGFQYQPNQYAGGPGFGQNMGAMNEQQGQGFEFGFDALGGDGSGSGRYNFGGNMH